MLLQCGPSSPYPVRGLEGDSTWGEVLIGPRGACHFPPHARRHPAIRLSAARSPVCRASVARLLQLRRGALIGRPLARTHTLPGKHTHPLHAPTTRSSRSLLSSPSLSGFSSTSYFLSLLLSYCFSISFSLSHSLSVFLARSLSCSLSLSFSLCLLILVALFLALSLSVFFFLQVFSGSF